MTLETHVYDSHDAGLYFHLYSIHCDELCVFYREGCWLAKDAYWSCLSTHGVEEPCATFRQEFESKCKKAWVKHFDRQREFQKFKAEAEKKRLEQQDGASWTSESRKEMWSGNGIVDLFSFPWSLLPSALTLNKNKNPMRLYKGRNSHEAKSA